MHFATVRAKFVFFSLLVILVFTISCGGSSVTMQNPFCSGCQFVYSTTNSGQILTFPISKTGGLGMPTSIAGPTNSAGIVALSPGSSLQLFMYISDPQANAIRVFNISSHDGSASTASVGPFLLGDANDTPGELAVFGSTLYVASSAGTIFAFSVNADGSLAGIAGSPFAAGTGISHLAAVTSSTVGNTNFLYAANTGDANGSISAFNISPSGGLTPVPGSPFPTVSGGGPSGFYAFGKTLYVALKNGNAVAAFATADDGSLTPISGSPFSAGRGTSSLTGADGFLFATNNIDGSISSYRIDALSGVLSEVAGSPFPAAVASGDTLYFNGRLFVPDASSNSISGFQPDLSTGAVSLLTGSPFQAGSGPLALTLVGFPVVDPPTTN
jgi:6-phosphogluconolactonase (cycloisomerase 2 family)